MNEKELVQRIIAQLEAIDDQRGLDLLGEFLLTARGLSPSKVVSSTGGAIAYVLMRDTAKPRPALAQLAHGCPKLPNIPRGIALAFTLGFYMGVFLNEKGEAAWPTTISKS